MPAYYNENNPRMAQWLRFLMKDDLIPLGYVDERSIEDVLPSDLSEYSQHHFFAGVGGWPYALRLAGWPDEKPVWTGSCPCQPFSAAGKGKGFADERHLWPAFQWLIRQCGPSTIYGEQVARKPGREWLAVVRSDLEVAGYAFGSADLCAASVGAWHDRPRHFWVAHSIGMQQRRKEPRCWAARRMGRVVQPVSWDRNWQEALCEFRSLDDGLSYGVALTDGLRNAIVPQVAKAFIENTI